MCIEVHECGSFAGGRSTAPSVYGATLGLAHGLRLLLSEHPRFSLHARFSWPAFCEWSGAPSRLAHLESRCSPEPRRRYRRGRLGRLAPATWWKERRRRHRRGRPLALRSSSKKAHQRMPHCLQTDHGPSSAASWPGYRSARDYRRRGCPGWSSGARQSYWPSLQRLGCRRCLQVLRSFCFPIPCPGSRRHRLARCRTRQVSPGHTQHRDRKCARCYRQVSYELPQHPLHEGPSKVLHRHLHRRSRGRSSGHRSVAFTLHRGRPCHGYSPCP